MRSRLALFFAAKSQHIQNPVEKNSSSLLSTKSFSLSFPVVSVALSLSLSYFYCTINEQLYREFATTLLLLSAPKPCE